MDKIVRECESIARGDWFHFVHDVGVPSQYTGRCERVRGEVKLLCRICMGNMNLTTCVGRREDDNDSGKHAINLFGAVVRC